VVVILYATDVNNQAETVFLNIVVSPVALGAGPVAIPDAAVVAQGSPATESTSWPTDVDPAGGGLTVDRPLR